MVKKLLNRRTEVNGLKRMGLVRTASGNSSGRSVFLISTARRIIAGDCWITSESTSR